MLHYTSVPRHIRTRALLTRLCWFSLNVTRTNMSNTITNTLQCFTNIWKNNVFEAESSDMKNWGSVFPNFYERRPGSLKIVVKRLSAQCDESHRNIEHLNQKISVNSKTITQSISDCEFLTNIQILKQLKILLKIYYVMPFGWTKNSTIHTSQILLHRKRSLGLLVSPSRK